MVPRNFKYFGSFLHLVTTPLRSFQAATMNLNICSTNIHSSPSSKSEEKNETRSIGEESSKKQEEPNKLSPMDEFFEPKDNWEKADIPSGRSWRKEDLRLKSNSDLHKLWYVLLKERNMLLTMSETYKFRVRPGPERIYKVEESMENLEGVVRERNRAYHELETGETGERRCKYELTRIGLWRLHKMEQHTIPKGLNKTWLAQYPQYIEDEKVDEFLRLFKEKELNKKRRMKTRDRMYLEQLMKRFPNVDRELLQEKYPEQNIEKISQSKAARSPYNV